MSRPHSFDVHQRYSSYVVLVAESGAASNCVRIFMSDTVSASHALSWLADNFNAAEIKSGIGDSHRVCGNCGCLAVKDEVHTLKVEICTANMRWRDD